MREIDIQSFKTDIFGQLDTRWLLLAVGDLSRDSFNCMTIGWGFLGVMWNKPCFIAAVRPTRYSYEFMNRYPDFTVTGFPESRREDLKILGSRSGRDGDKLGATTLTPIPASKVASPSFREANLLIECKTMYRSDLDPKAFIDPSIAAHYDGTDHHRMYYGEVLSISTK